MSSGNSAYAAETPNSLHTLPMGDMLDSVPLTPPRAAHATPDGYTEILAWAARQVRIPDLDPVAHGILTQIARFATRDGYAWPSIDTLRRLAKRTSRTVRSAIDRLEGHGNTPGGGAGLAATSQPLSPRVGLVRGEEHYESSLDT